ncbi:hypothetical protein GCM10010260_29190 [Streptomyces filipinensis]|uniref:DUF2867 domain-containing protein n=1 Tax=Streptomyces filipinensis TaxID=66887 RepID=A0A918MBJ5_9ACTN|nr:hypothetical protein [Streptomyces filipinensis]GGU92637.1 hypothetical protein GCM10010260_29190 [Streptomyces filipinensis]
MDWIIDRLLPAYDFRTRYTREIAAAPTTVWAALHSVTHDELPATRLLMSIRHLGRTGDAGPLLQKSPMPLLGQEEPREVVAGKVAKFWYPRPVPGPESSTTPEGFAAFAEPGWGKAVMSFQLSPLPDGRTLLAAETRLQATDATVRRTLACYWLLIRAGGAGYIRRELLRAISRHAEERERDNRHLKNRARN